MLSIAFLPINTGQLEFSLQDQKKELCLMELHLFTYSTVLEPEV